MSEERFRVIRSALDDEPFSGLFDAALVRSFPYQLPVGTDSWALRRVF